MENTETFRMRKYSKHIHRPKKKYSFWIVLVTDGRRPTTENSLIVPVQNKGLSIAVFVFFVSETMLLFHENLLKLPKSVIR